VFNHTGSDSIYFNKHGNYNSLGAYQSKESPYYDWFYFDQFPDKYGCWWGSQVVPTVNKSAEGYRNLILGQNGVIEKWTKMGVKGWRLDVVDELPIDFTTDLCQKIKSVNPDCAIIGEVWEDASTKVAYSEWRPYFMGEQLDGVMNYPFKESILSYVLGGKALDFVGNVTRILENYPKESLDSCMTLVGSHDTARILTVLAGVYAPHTKEERAKFILEGDLYDRAKARLKFASTLQYVLPGVPCLYYGDEAGVYGYEDPLNRGTYPWGREDLDLVKHYQTIGALRKEYEDFFLGETTFENLSDFGFDLVRRCDKGELRMKVKGDQATTLVNGQEVFSIE
jgi:glycosidase